MIVKLFVDSKNFEESKFLFKSLDLYRSAADTFAFLYNVDIPESAFFPFQGMGDKVYFESVAKLYNVQSFNLEQVLSSFLKVYADKLGSKNIAFPG